jgi:membrane-bound lytic murein transglycosylase B
MSIVRVRSVAVVLAGCMTIGPTAGAQEPETKPSFDSWLAGARTEALARGISETTIARALDGLEPLPVVVERDRTQAETVLTVDEYVRRRLTPRFVRTANDRVVAERVTLRRVADRYGVQPRFLVAVWGLESNFGRFSGVRPVVQALATLAWEGRRGTFFTNELMDALRIVDRGDIDLDSMKGSWAGAMGQTQFMPSSYLEHAEDFDGDGDRDIWRSTPDVLASIAKYLKAHGWKADETWGREVRLPAAKADAIVEQAGLRATGCRAEREMTIRQPLKAWQASGVRTVDGKALPRADRDASLFRAGKRAYLVYGNYEALLGYNCAHAYALAVSQLADRIRAREAPPRTNKGVAPPR